MIVKRDLEGLKSSIESNSYQRKKKGKKTDLSTNYYHHPF